MLSADVAKIQAVSVKEPTQFAELLSCGDLLLTRIKRIDMLKKCIKTCLCACVRLMS